MIDDLTRSILEQRDNIENQRNREIKSNEKIIERTPQEVHDNIVKLLQENQQLKEMFEDSKTFSKQFLYKHNKNLLEANERLLQQRNKYKEIIEEVRKHTEENLSFCENDSQGAYDVCNIRMVSDRKLLQILDKVKDVK